MNRNGRSCRAGTRSDADDAGLDCEIRSRERFLFIAQLEAVAAAETFGNSQWKVDFPVFAGLHLPDRFFLSAVSGATDAASHESLPDQIECRVRRKAFAAQRHVGI